METRVETVSEQSGEIPWSADDVDLAFVRRALASLEPSAAEQLSAVQVKLRRIVLPIPGPRAASEVTLRVRAAGQIAVDALMLHRLP